MEDTKDLLRSYFVQNGILLCNENPDLPSLPSVGGTWNDIVTMMEDREVFYSKLYKGRVTYLSREFYYHIKSLRQGRSTSPPRLLSYWVFSYRRAPPAPRS